MNDNDAKFTVIDENNVERVANVITVVEIEGIEYIVYSIDTDSENCDVLVSRLVKNSDGSDSILDIEDENESVKVKAIVKEILNG